MHACARARVSVCKCVRACVRACLHVCVCVCVCVCVPCAELQERGGRGGCLVWMSEQVGVGGWESKQKSPGFTHAVTVRAVRLVVQHPLSEFPVALPLVVFLLN